MLNKKGFTLVELLAAFTILGIIMLVAIPNVMGILDRHKQDVYVNSAQRMIALAKYQISANSMNLERDTLYTFPLQSSTDIGEVPDEGYKWDTAGSAVAVCVDYEGIFHYFVQLMEFKENAGGTYENVNGVTWTEESSLEDIPKNNYIKNSKDGTESYVSSRNANTVPDIKSKCGSPTKIKEVG